MKLCEFECLNLTLFLIFPQLKCMFKVLLRNAMYILIVVAAAAAVVHMYIELKTNCVGEI